MAFWDPVVETLKTVEQFALNVASKDILLLNRTLVCCVTQFKKNSKIRNIHL